MKKAMKLQKDGMRLQKAIASDPSVGKPKMSKSNKPYKHKSHNPGY